jgi:hypothetical protein
MFWHVKYRKTNENHKTHWYSDTEKQLMDQYIARHKTNIHFNCWRTYVRQQFMVVQTLDFILGFVKRLTTLQGRPRKGWRMTFRLCLQFSQAKQHGVLPYCVVLQCLAARYLGAGVIDPPFLDKGHPCRSSSQFSLMLWNLGNWCRSRFNKCPLPERLQKFAPHIDYEMDRDHEKIGSKPQFNNYFINVVKNLGAHLLWFARLKASILTSICLKRSSSRRASTITATWW